MMTSHSEVLFEERINSLARHMEQPKKETLEQMIVNFKEAFFEAFSLQLYLFSEFSLQNHKEFLKFLNANQALKSGSDHLAYSELRTYKHLCLESFDLESFYSYVECNLFCIKTRTHITQLKKAFEILDAYKDKFIAHFLPLSQNKAKADYFANQVALRFNTGDPYGKNAKLYIVQFLHHSEAELKPFYTRQDIPAAEELKKECDLKHDSLKQFIKNLLFLIDEKCILRELLTLIK